MDRFAQLIQARQQAGETDRDFARRLGIDQGNWSRILHGQRRVPRSLAARAIALWPELGQVYLAEITATDGARCAKQQKAS